ncbi:hypothetical protein K492DRAFT_194362 [Lichtheimia hyalospora FSU 10163]|nr:hypothetical protein K492DRAFT_194362 [Lichtheimia hyalospora FSU 10163]
MSKRQEGTEPGSSWKKTKCQTAAQKPNELRSYFHVYPAHPPRDKTGHSSSGLQKLPNDAIWCLNNADTLDLKAFALQFRLTNRQYTSQHDIAQLLTSISIIQGHDITPSYGNMNYRFCDPFR